MTQARLLVDIPDGPWIADISKRYPDATFQVLSALPGEAEGFGLMWIRSEDVGSIIEDIRNHETLKDLSVVQQAETAATVQVTTTKPMILLAAKRTGIPVEMPIEIQNGTATVDVSGAHDRLSELGEQFSEMGIDFEIEYIQERLETGQLLTDRQQELLTLAVSMGYYDTPRRCTLTELAEEIGLAKSTCSETLHRAEEVIIKKFAEDLLPRMDLGSDSKTRGSQ